MITLDKQYKTRDGREVKLWDIIDSRMFGAVLDADNNWRGADWRLNGEPYNMYNSRGGELIEVKPRHKLNGYFLVFETPTGLYTTAVYTEAKHAINAQHATGNIKHLACIKIELDFEEGEGL